MQPQVVSYMPTPKLPAALPDGRFLAWALHESRESIPYGPILGEPRDVSPLVAQLQQERVLAEDQDDYREEEGMEF
jgi:hypothetical protein